jgi:hypothetical protein
MQALLEMQQVGEHAVPQAFCDHQAAARDFLEAYVHAYPQLVLEDGAIPTPDHLQSLIANGQIGALGQPLERAAFGAQAPFGGQRPAEPSSSNGFPIVVLTLGTSQVLIDAMQQSPAMKDSIRLIDIAPSGADGLPASIADVVTSGGLDDGGWEGDGPGAARQELDEVASASTRASGDFALERDPLDLDRVEATAAPAGAVPGHDEGEGEVAATAAPAAPAEPAPTAAAAPAVEPAAADEVASLTAEPVPAQASAVEPIRPVDTEPVVAEPVAQADEIQGEDPADDQGDGGTKGAGGDPGEDIAEEDTGKGVLDDDDDVYYPPVGDLLIGSDVFYPALDRAAAPGVLQELISVMLDDAIFDPDHAFEGLPPPDDLSPARLREDLSTIRSSENVVTIEDLYGTFDDEHEDVFADAGMAPSSHDTDL